MKSRSLTYLLIAVVLTVWGVIAYKLFSGVNQNTSGNERKVITGPINKITDNESLKLNYPDPFLKGIKKDHNNSGKIKHVRSVKSSTEKINIVYMGKVYIGSSVYYMLAENDTCHTIRAGKRAFSGIKIIKEVMDTLIVEKNNSNYRLTKAK